MIAGGRCAATADEARARSFADWRSRDALAKAVAAYEAEFGSITDEELLLQLARVAGLQVDVVRV